MNFIEELQWRGMIQDIMPGTDQYLAENRGVGYVGFDPTATSLGVGNLVPIMLLTFFQRHGHTPLALVGGATGMIGDPAGKLAERKLLDEEQIRYNVSRQQAQLERFLDFSGSNAARIVNNYDWFKDFSLLHFLRDVGKHSTIAYMMAKDSVKSRLATGISFTEFTYQLIQAYDFFHLWKHEGCMLQMGGSDQWGNITAGTDLISSMEGGKAYALTTPLLTKSDGTKFGKSEAGNVWLDPELTTPYDFYQFFLRAHDADIPRLMKTFSIRPQEEILHLLHEQAAQPESRVAQMALAAELTERIHGRAALDRALEASQKLFSLATAEDLRGLDADMMKEAFKDVPTRELGKTALEAGMDVLDFLVAAGAAASKSEARRSIEGNSISINLEKCSDPKSLVNMDHVISNRFILVNVGKKKKFLVYVV